jgi:hypothetical protein
MSTRLMGVSGPRRTATRTAAVSAESSTATAGRSTAALP